MSLYWLAYRQGPTSCVVVVEAPALAVARIKADVMYRIDRHFAAGHELEPEQAASVPSELIGQVLSARIAAKLFERIRAVTTRRLQRRRTTRY
jgi:hypothetical protein